MKLAETNRRRTESSHQIQEVDMDPVITALASDPSAGFISQSHWYRATNRLATATLALALGVGLPTAEGSIIRYDISGTISNISYDANNATTSIVSIQAGDPWAATLFIDSGSTDQSNYSSTVGVYGPVSGALSFGSNLDYAIAGTPAQVFQVFCCGLNEHIRFYAPTGNSMLLDDYVINLLDISLGFDGFLAGITSDDLTETFRPLSEFDNATAVFSFARVGPTGTHYTAGGLIGTVTTYSVATTVPLPPAIWLMGGAIGTLTWRRFIGSIATWFK